MADFPGLILTRAGRQILTRALIGQPLTFTRAAIGTGQAPADAEGLTALVDERRSLAIAKMDTPGDGTASVEVVLTNAGVEQGFERQSLGRAGLGPPQIADRHRHPVEPGERPVGGAFQVGRRRRQEVGHRTTSTRRPSSTGASSAAGWRSAAGAIRSTLSTPSQCSAPIRPERATTRPRSARAPA